MGVKESILPLKWKDGLLPNSRRGAACSKHKAVSTSAEVDLRDFLKKVP